MKVPEPLQVTSDIVLNCPTKDQAEIIFAPGVSEEETQRAVFGDKYDSIMKLFGDKSIYLWREFMKRYMAHFFNEADQGK